MRQFLRYLIFLLPLTAVNDLVAELPSSSIGNTLKISLLTYSPGEKLYALFGHSAIRVQNPGTGTDDVYNYGTFDFDQPNFYISFIRGNLLYSLSRLPYEYVLRAVEMENRSLVETPLILTSQEAQRILVYLENNMKPENREYTYDFQYDNCSTRITELLNSEISDTLIVKAEVLPVGTFRRLLDPYVAQRPWVHMGIDLVMGLRVDRMARLLEPSFLPDYLHRFVKNFYVSGTDSSYRLAGTDIIRIRNYVPYRKRKVTPGLIFWPLALLLLISTLINSHFRPFFMTLGNLFILFIGILSLLLIFLWAFTSQQIFANNTDILWANPLLFLIYFLREKPTLFRKFLTIATMLMIVAGVLSSLFIEHNPEITSLAVIPGIQLMSWIRHTENKTGSE